MVNTVNRYIGKSIIARKPITRGYYYHNIKKKEVGHLGRHHNIRNNIVNFSVIGIKSKTEVLFCEEFTKVYKIII